MLLNIIPVDGGIFSTSTSFLYIDYNTACCILAIVADVAA